MQEHIRRAHPEYYIPKLPATKESFELMINSPPHERPPQDTHGNPLTLPQHPQHSDPSGLSPAFNLDHAAGLNPYEGYHNEGYHNTFGPHDGGYYPAADAGHDPDAAAIMQSMQQAAARSSDEYRRGSIIPAASAAAALASLHNYRPDPEWGSDNLQVDLPIPYPAFQLSPTNTEADFLQNFYADQNSDMKTNHFNVDPALEENSFLPDHTGNIPDHGFPPSSAGHDQVGLMSGALTRSPTDRPATQPLQRSLSRTHGNRPRKSSLTQARLAKHERRRSKELAKRSSGDRKAFSAEPSASALQGKRWEDLIDAAASATEEEGSRDLTPVSVDLNTCLDRFSVDDLQIPASPYQSPQVASRTSLPPFALGSQFQSTPFQASPLNRALTPPAADPGLPDLQNFPSVESTLSTNLSHSHHNSADSTGSQFQIMNPNSMDSNNTSPMFTGQPQIQIYCAGCRKLSVLKESYACTNCICGLCGNCVEAIINGQSRGRMSMCPRCNGMDSSFKPFQLDLR
jgi:hypothetical protein